MVRNHVPFDVAFDLPDEWRIAFAIVFGGFEGNKFDWDRFDWREPDH